MPIYEYRCQDCGHEFEKMVRLDAPIPPCASCGKEHVKKLVSAASFVLKGGGWYKDHYGLKSSSTKSESSGGSSSEASSSSAEAPAAKPSPTSDGGGAA